MARLGSPETTILATPFAKSTKKYMQKLKSARLLHFFKLLESKDELDHETVAFFESLPLSELYLSLNFTSL